MLRTCQRERPNCRSAVLSAVFGSKEKGWGEEGDDGSNETDGSDGTDGSDEADGADEADGSDGTDGRDDVVAPGELPLPPARKMMAMATPITAIIDRMMRLSLLVI